MDRIDGNWIEARLTGRHGEKAEIARAIGVKSKQISEILSGARRVQHDEALRLLEYFGESAPGDTGHPPGFGEGTVAALVPERGTPADEILRVARQTFQHPQLYRATRGDQLSAIVAGDLLIVNLGQEPDDGQTVVCTLTDLDTGTGETFVKRLARPWLLTASDQVRIEDDDQSIGILGPVVGIIRGDFVRASDE